MVSSSLPILLLSWCYLIVISLGQDRITPGNPVTDNETITSVGETFVLGFFNPGNLSNRYVGIWYNNIPGPTVVWVANRDNPITDSAGSLSIDQHGNLVVLDGRNNTLWSTNITESVTGNEGVSASLLQSGNLVLRHRNDTVLWESFDYPSDTFLPGMRLRMNLTTGAAWNISSWRDADDPAPGSFSLAIDHQSSLVQIVMWRGSDRLWRSGPWAGGFSGGLTQSANFVSYYTVVVIDQEIYITFAPSDDTVPVRSVLTYTGRVEQLLWRENSQRWELVWWRPNYNTCDAYSACGPFGTCTWRGSEAQCECLQGYVPKFEEEWSTRNWSSGCVRYRELDCDRGGDGFLMLEQMTLPDLPLSVERSSSLGECEDQCRSNCSCFAYAFANVTGTANSTCLVWERDLIDLYSNNSLGHTLYFRQESSELGGGTTKIRTILLATLIPIAVFTCLTSCCIYCYWRRKRSDRTVFSDIGSELQNKTMLTANVNHINNASTSSSKDEIAPWVPLFQFSSILAATDNFIEANKLGQGGFGPVYKGRLMGQDVAVKRLSKSSGQGLTELRNEVELIAKLQHKNLVRLLGWCAHEDEKMLIYEYLPNKSLDNFLFDAKQKVLLDWKTRFNIVKGIAQGLLYLHRYSRLKIIHRDLKASNILLDGEMNPKISDFGMARIFGGNQTEANTSRVVGTFGYMAPEYALDGNFSEKSDVFSFGVLLIEIVTGKKNTGFYPSKHSIHLLGNVWHSWVEGRGMELIDPVCGEEYDAQEVLKCINVGLLCVQEDATDRPTMESVISMLDGDSSSLPKPNMPAFSISTRTSRIACPAAVAETENNSVNQVTISTPAPR